MLKSVQKSSKQKHVNINLPHSLCIPTFKKLRSRPHHKKSALSSRHNC